ncbi:MAG: DUF262 domain-containing protein [Candidatus Atribacteria bacterium]|nr:DUF262 domain-containing protein [Candidatus Atribacteria bacterium]
MEKDYNKIGKIKCTIDWLSKNTNNIEFPEFQREPSIWKLVKKQRLIDSIFRGFDIASIYLFKREDDKYDCIDGQQRINAIWSYLGINHIDPDNNFHSKIDNELYDDKGFLNKIDQKRFDYLDELYQNQFMNYELNIVFISNIEEEEELNLQFIRLQLGAPLRAGEKLNAMRGDMRDLIFSKATDGLIEMEFFNNTGIRKGRFGREEVAAQILLNAFSKKETNEFHRSRYLDLQEFFKEKEKFSIEDKRLIDETKNTLKVISDHFKTNLVYINNKALAVSVFLFISELQLLNKDSEINDFVNFFIKFLKTKKWQISQGLDMNKAYRGILNFQTSLTQAAGEKNAIQQRHDFWRDYFSYFKEKKMIMGDEAFFASEGINPDDERDSIEL